MLSSIEVNPPLNTRPYWTGVVLLVGALLLASLLLVWQGSNPAVRARQVTPAPGSLVSVKPAIRLRFSRAVDKSSVEGKVVVSPEFAFELSWAENELRILPRSPLLAETDYTVTVGPGLRDANGNEMAGQVQWQFRTRQPRLAFILFQGDNASELWMVDLSGENAQRLSAPGQAVRDFDAAPDGSTLVYTVEEGPDTVGLWRVEPEQRGFTRLTEEPNVVYGSPRFGPSGDLLAVEVREMVQIGDQGSALSPPRLELRRPADGSPAGEIYGKQGEVGHSPRWSPNGTRLAFFEANSSAVGIFNFTSDLRFFPGESALLGSQGWSPDSRALTYTVLHFAERGAQQNVVMRDLELGTESNLGEPIGDQADPAWHPDGSIIAYAYKPPSGLNTGAGIWLMRPDGSGRIPLVTDPNAIFSLPLWSPDGEWLIFSRFDPIGEPQQSLWAIRRDGSDLHQVAADGFQPAWVP